MYLKEDTQRNQVLINQVLDDVKQLILLAYIDNNDDFIINVGQVIKIIDDYKHDVI